MAQAAGISPALLHRVAVMAAGGMDTLPHCGAIITLLAICKLNHRQSYGDIAAVTMLFPLPALVMVIALGTCGQLLRSITVSLNAWASGR